MAIGLGTAMSLAASGTCAQPVDQLGILSTTTLFPLRPGEGAAVAPAPGEASRAEQQRLLDITLRQPNNIEAILAYAQVSRRLRDWEAAIGALERLIDYNPNLSRAQYELGLLYYEMRSYDASARYLRRALETPGLDPETAARVSSLLPDAEKGTQQSRWFGFAQLGLRYQSNANYVPTNSLVRISAQDFLLAPRFREKPDGSGFGLLQIGNDYDLETPRGDVLETRLTAFGSAQFRQTEFNYGFVEASFGPRFGLPELTEGASVKIYGVGQTSFLARERSPYVSSGGGGVSVRVPVLEALTVEPGFEARAISVQGRGADAFSSFENGSALNGYMVATLRVTDDVDFEGTVAGLRAEGSRSWQSFTKVGGIVAMNVQFDPPSALIGRRWKVSPFVGAASIDYDGANPFLDPLVRRRDTEFRTGLVFDAPLTPTFGFSATVQYDRIDSNLPNYRVRDVSVLAGPTARF